MIPVPGTCFQEYRICVFSTVLFLAHCYLQWLALWEKNALLLRRELHARRNREYHARADCDNERILRERYESSGTADSTKQKKGNPYVLI